MELSNNQTAEGVVCFFFSASCSASDPGGPGGEMSKLPDKETSGGGAPRLKTFSFAEIKGGKYCFSLVIFCLGNGANKRN